MVRRMILLAWMLTGAACGGGSDSNSTTVGGTTENGGNGGDVSEVVIPQDCSTITPAVTVRMRNQRFEDDSVRIQPGAVVRWVNEDSEQHTITSGHPEGSDGGALFDSGLLAPGDEYCFQFNQIGTFEYFCAIHPDVMRDARVTVSTSGDDDNDNDDDNDRGGGNDDEDNPSR